MKKIPQAITDYMASIGKSGGRKTSDAKKLAVSANAAKARAALAEKRKLGKSEKALDSKRL